MHLSWTEATDIPFHQPRQTFPVTRDEWMILEAALHDYRPITAKGREARESLLARVTALNNEHSKKEPI